MAEHILKCLSCNKYTLESTCSQCNNPAVIPKPPKYSPEDKYGDYRRQIKREELKKINLY
jgi:H/ACA ribonucleoprotein complex subunit 3